MAGDDFVGQGLVLALSLALATAGCSSSGHSGADGGLGADKGLAEGMLTPGTVVDAGLYTLTVLASASAASCDVHAETPPTFTDTTARWGLASLGFTALYAADLDHDGYPDLVAMVGSGRETPAFGTAVFTTSPMEASSRRWRC